MWILNKIIKLLFMLGLFIFPTSVWAACPGGTCTLADCEYATVNTAVNTTATYGDTVVCPSDTTTWGTPLVITKAITLIGAGKESTVITNSGDYAIYYNPDSTSASNDYQFKVSGFSFSKGILFIDNAVSYYDVDTANDTQTTAKTKMVIDNNNVSSFYIDGTFWGVIYSNTITGSGNVIGHIANGVGDFNRYDDYLTYGDSRAFYLEDNTFTGSNLYTETGAAARWIWRYNGNSTTTGNYPFLDTHGCQETGNPGAMLIEVYGNIFTFSSDGTWMYQRGGRVLMFNNRNSGDGSVDSIWQDDDIDPDVSCNTTYEPASGIVSPNTSYFWNNWDNGSLTSATIGNNGFGHLGLNVTAWNYNSNTLNGSTQQGINCGASIPTTGNPSCSEGDGFWVTSYSPCSTPPTTLADMRTYTQAGRLYRCNAAGAWELYFTPYTYPHPLRGEVAPIRGLTILNGNKAATIGTGNKSIRIQ